jgi:hypothetical protein
MTHTETQEALARALELVDQSGVGGLVDLTEVVQIAREAESLGNPVTARR